MRRSLLLLTVFAAAAFAVASAPQSAHAGGVGFYNGTGFHFGPALTGQGGDGAWLNEGGGVEVLLGRNDGRVHGRLRFAYNAIIDLGDASSVRHSAFLSLGAKIELLDDTTTPFGLYLGTDLGVSPLVTHLRSYFSYSIGPGVRIRPVERLALFAEVALLVRYEKVFAAGPTFFFGARISFD